MNGHLITYLEVPKRVRLDKIMDKTTLSNFLPPANCKIDYCRPVWLCLWETFNDKHCRKLALSCFVGKKFHSRHIGKHSTFNFGTNVCFSQPLTKTYTFAILHHSQRYFQFFIDFYFSFLISLAMVLHFPHKTKTSWGWSCAKLMLRSKVKFY